MKYERWQLVFIIMKIWILFNTAEREREMEKITVISLFRINEYCMCGNRDTVFLLQNEIKVSSVIGNYVY